MCTRENLEYHPQLDTANQKTSTAEGECGSPERRCKMVHNVEWPPN
jgi:hypothetical protein